MSGLSGFIGSPEYLFGMLLILLLLMTQIAKTHSSSGSTSRGSEVNAKLSNISTREKADDAQQPGT